MCVIRCDPRFSHGPWILRFLCSQLLVLYISGSNRYISLRGGKRRAQKRAKARDTQHHKILGSRTKESPIPSVATPWSRGPPSAESYCLIGVATGGIEILLFCSPGFCGVGVGVGCLLRALSSSLLGRLVILVLMRMRVMSHVIS